jgi:glutamate--cysteine ligase
MQEVCAILDGYNPDKLYGKALSAQQQLVQNPDLTASARVLADMTTADLPFSRFGLSKSLEHADCFKGHPPDAQFASQFNEMAEKSLAKQADMENKPQLPFDEFLHNYFTQKCENDC